MLLRRGVDRLLVDRREDDRERPLEAFGDAFRSVAHRVVGPDVDVALLAGAAIEARQQAAVAAGVIDVGIERIRRDVAALAAADVVVIRVLPEAAGLARHARRRVVLLRAADLIRDVRGQEHVVELRGRIVLIRPRLPAVDADVRAAVVRFDHAVRIARRDPHVVVVAVRHAHVRDRLAGVGRLVDVDVQDPDGVLDLRIGVDARVVERALADVAVVVDLLPRRARVVGDDTGRPRVRSRSARRRGCCRRPTR